MKLNTVHHLNFLDNTLPDKCANLIIADPPYYKVKGDFDFIWKTFDEYLKDVEKWAVECKRLLADNGTILYYGDAKNIAYSQIIFDKHFNLLNNLVWENTNQAKQSMVNVELRSFAPLTERILMYSNDFDVSSLDGIMFNAENFKEIKDYLKQEKKKVMLHYNFTAKQFNEYTLQLGCSTTPYKNWFCNTGFWEMATEAMYNKLQKSGFFQKPFNELKQEYEVLRQEYEVLRQEYEDLRRPFNNSFKLGDVIRLPNYETANYDHDTVKPEKLTRALILTCSRENDLVIVPFAGSGTECAMSAKENRNFVGFEITKKYVDMANKRINNHMAQTKLF